MIFGLKNIPVELGIIMEGDSETPVSMVGRKVVPILYKEDGTYMPESMDIVHYIDSQSGTVKLQQNCDKDIESWCREVTRIVYNLAIPRFTRADFKELSTPGAREAYTQREIKAFGNLDELISDTPVYVKQVLSELVKIQSYLTEKNDVTLTDFYLFPLLNSLTIVKGFPYPEYLTNYLQTIAEKCKVPLFTDKAL